MSDFSLPRMSELIRGVIGLLWSKSDGVAGNEVIIRLPELIRLTPYELELLPASRVPRYEQAVRLAALSLQKAGWLTKTDKGQWFLTEDGRDACRKYSEPQDLFLEAMRLSEGDRQHISEALVLLELIKEKSWEGIAHHIRSKNIVEIRKLLEALFDALQYHVIWSAPPQKNRGVIDMVVNPDPFGVQGARVLVQIKHTGQPVTVEGLKSFSAALGAGDFGLLFSTGGFTAEVRSLLRKDAYQKINAMDLERFYDVWIGHYGKLSREAHIILPLQAIYFLSPPE